MVPIANVLSVLKRDIDTEKIVLFVQRNINMVLIVITVQRVIIIRKATKNIKEGMCIIKKEQIMKRRM
jgi:hypothetical protein